MKKLFLIVLFTIVMSVSAFAKAGDIKIISSSNDFIRIKLSIGTFYISDSKYWEAFEKLAQEADFYCENNNKIAYFLLGNIEGELKLYKEPKVTSHTFNIFCANSLTEAIDLYKQYRFPKLFDGMPINFVTDPSLGNQSVALVLEDEKRKREIELAKKKAEEEKIQKYKADLKKRTEEYERKRIEEERKKLTEIVENTNKSKSNKKMFETIFLIIFIPLGSLVILRFIYWPFFRDWIYKPFKENPERFIKRAAAILFGLAILGAALGGGGDYGCEPRFFQEGARC